MFSNRLELGSRLSSFLKHLRNFTISNCFEKLLFCQIVSSEATSNAMWKFPLHFVWEFFIYMSYKQLGKTQKVCSVDQKPASDTGTHFSWPSQSVLAGNHSESLFIHMTQSSVTKEDSLNCWREHNKMSFAVTIVKIVFSYNKTACD